MNPQKERVVSYSASPVCAILDQSMLVGMILGDRVTEDHRGHHQSRGMTISVNRITLLIQHDEIKRSPSCLV